MNRILPALLLATCGISSCNAATVATASYQPDVVGVYSDINHILESGDVIGIEVQVIYSKDGYSVLFQDAEGALRKPSLVDAVVNQNKIEFVLPERTGYSGKFIGLFNKNGLIGSFADGQVDANGESKFLLRKIKCEIAAKE